MDADGSVNSPDDLAELYRNRFDEAEVASKRVLWGALCSGFFQAYVPEEGSVVDLGAGNCEFTNAIRASRRIAVDLNPETKSFADAGVTVLETSSTDLSALEDASIDTCSPRTSSNICRAKLCCSTPCKLRPVWPIFGRQMLVVASRRSVTNEPHRTR